MTPELAQAIRESAARVGIKPLDLGTVISYETGGTFNPWQRGPTTQWGQHRGLIQWGTGPGGAAQRYGVHQNMTVGDQLKAAERYLKDAGVRPGMGLMDIYSAVNAGKVGRYNASDAGNGGAPGTVADKVNNQMAGHRAKAARLLGETDGAPATPTGSVAQAGAAPTLLSGAAPQPDAPTIEQRNSLADMYILGDPATAAVAPLQQAAMQREQQAAQAAKQKQARKQALFGGGGLGGLYG